MKRNLTCIVCPLGCGIEVEIENGEITKITGNTCPRGAEYAKNECTNPTRVITSTVMCESGIPVAVKTDKAIPKDKIFECMKEINGVVAKTPLKIGDVLAENVLNTGANLVATQNVK